MLAMPCKHHLYKDQTWTICGLVEEEILSRSEEREPLHKDSDGHTTTPMLTCAEL